MLAGRIVAELACCCPAVARRNAPREAARTPVTLTQAQNAIFNEKSVQTHVSPNLELFRTKSDRELFKHGRALIR